MPLKLLVVEDEPIVSLDIKKRLEVLGYGKPLLASSGEEAVRVALAEQPALILMDIMLEGDMDGIDAAALIREQYNIPVIYLTAYADEETLQRAKITEPFGYIIKPFEDRELQTCIEMAIYKHDTEKRLLESERWLATTLRSIGDAVLTTDEKGLIRFFNPVAEGLTGLRSQDCLGRAFHEAVHIMGEEGGEEIKDIVAATLAQGQGFRPKSPLLLTSANGSLRPIDLTSSVIHGDNNDALGVVLVMRDITERKNSEEALRKSLSDLRRTLEETVTALAVTTEKRDPYTSGHQQRVAKLASAMAREMGLPAEQVEGIRVASLLHDIGKIYIPAEILSKPATLTSMEMGIMKTHPEVGYDILKGVSFPWPVAEIVLQHHERMDGSGYPRGLGNGEILPEARIIMVADVVEAMSSHRPYRAALGLTQALEEIIRFLGKRYEKEAAEACLELFQSRGFRFD